MNMDVYKQLAKHLDALPNGFPPAGDGSELRLLQKLFTPEEAELAAQLTSSLETVTRLPRAPAGETPICASSSSRWQEAG